MSEQRIICQIPAPVSAAQMGAQLTEQYRRATGGMREVLKFGAMMMMLEEGLEKVSSTVDETKARRGPTAKGKGVEAWLKEHAPEVKKGTAYRFKAVAESVAKEYVALVGNKFSQQHPLPQLVSAAAEELPPPVRAKQELLFGFIDGTSQKSWLDKFKARPMLGGAREKKGDTAYDPNAAVEVARDLLLIPLRNVAMRWAEMEDKAPLWTHLPHAELAEIDSLLMDLRADLKKALKKEGK